MIKVDLNTMKESYGYLFEIENYLRTFIKQYMELEYGPNWELVSRKFIVNSITNRKINDLYFHELISFIKLFKCLYINMSTDTIVKLKSISTIRNKIAHCLYLNKTDSEILCSIHGEIIKDRLLSIKNEHWRF